MENIELLKAILEELKLIRQAITKSTDMGEKKKELFSILDAITTANPQMKDIVDKVKGGIKNGFD